MHLSVGIFASIFTGFFAFALRDSESPLELRNGTSTGLPAKHPELNESDTGERSVETRSKAIAVGKCADDTLYPFSVVLDSAVVVDGQAGRICHGAIVSPMWILSNLACFLGVPTHPIAGWITVRYGGDNITIIKVVRHYRGSYNIIEINDVALAKTEREMKNCQPIRLPTTKDRIADTCTSPLVVKRFKDNSMVCFDYTMVAAEICTSQPNVAARSESILCAQPSNISGALAGPADNLLEAWAKTGDYGSQMVCQSDSNTLIGMLGERFLLNTSAQLFTRVDYYLEFIHSVIDNATHSSSGNPRGIPSGIYSLLCPLLAYYCITFVLN